jgi:uncharacterized protein YcbX
MGQALDGGGCNGDFLTQRSHPRMALIRPEITDAYLLLHFPGMDSLQIPLGTGQQMPCAGLEGYGRCLGSRCMGAPARSWLSRALAEDCRLVRFDASRPRRASERWVGDGDAPVHFADGYPLLLLSQSAVDELNQRLTLAGEAAVDARRFRPNIVIADIEAHDEDRVEQLDLPQLPGLSLLPCKPCTRCPIPDMDPDTAVPGTAVGDSISGLSPRIRVWMVLLLWYECSAGSADRCGCSSRAGCGPATGGQSALIEGVGL